MTITLTVVREDGEAMRQWTYEAQIPRPDKTTAEEACAWMRDAIRILDEQAQAGAADDDDKPESWQGGETA
jgi:hypothetical protein